MKAPLRTLAFMALAALAGATISVAVPIPVMGAANLTVCSKATATRAALGFMFAVGYHSPGVNDPADHSVLTGPFVSRGWYKVPAGQCVAVANPFNARYMFWWADDVLGANGHYTVDPTDTAVWTVANPWSTTGNDNFCIPNPYIPQLPPFTFEDENRSAAACLHRGTLAEEQQRCIQPPHDCFRNIWVAVRKVDLDIETTVNYSGE